MNNNYHHKVSSKIYKFERVRLGNKTVSESGAKYGPYLYKNIEENILIASWDPPTSTNPNFLYKGEDIGYNTDALIYYKNI